MRIIAGEHRGRSLAAPPGRGTRPMLDRVREALFSAISTRTAGARVLDLYAGTGSLGLEAVSRGAAFVRLVERDARVLRVLAANVRGLDVGARVDVRRGDALDPRRWRRDPAERFDLVFLDPPYPLWGRANARERLLGAIANLALEGLEPDGLIVVHAPRGALDAAVFDPLATRLREYGTTALWYLRRPDEFPSPEGAA